MNYEGWRTVGWGEWVMGLGVTGQDQLSVVTGGHGDR